MEIEINDIVHECIDVNSIKRVDSVIQMWNVNVRRRRRSRRFYLNICLPCIGSIGFLSFSNSFW